MRRLAIWALLPLSSLLFFTNSCQSPSKDKDKTVSPSATNLPSGWKSFDLRGENLLPSVNAAGDRFVFVSRKRPGHSLAQVYEWNIAASRETRITFNDGSNLYPVYHPKQGDIFYSSSTDELKQDPFHLGNQWLAEREGRKPAVVAFPLLYPVLSELTPMEIYRKSINGEGPHQLTSRQGFDAQLNWAGSGNRGIFTSEHNGRLGLFSFHSNGAGPAVVVDQFHNFDPALNSAGDKLIWIRTTDGFDNIEFVTSPLPKLQIKVLSDGKSWMRNPHFHSTEPWILYAKAEAPKTDYDIWLMKDDGSCDHPITKVPTDEIQPVWKGTSSSILFASNRVGAFQIYEMDLKDQLKCP